MNRRHLAEAEASKLHERKRNVHKEVQIVLAIRLLNMAKRKTRSQCDHASPTVWWVRIMQYCKLHPTVTYFFWHGIRGHLHQPIAFTHHGRDSQDGDGVDLHF
jgi:hypothetical protein